MNLLIVAGLLIFALIAILGAVLLTLSEQKASQAKITPVAPTPKEVAKPLEERGGQNLPVPVQTTAPVAVKEQNLPALNGQFNEFATELRSLHANAIELEQRLGLLQEMVDQIEHTRSGHVSIEEELNPIS